MAYIIIKSTQANHNQYLCNYNNISSKYWQTKFVINSIGTSSSRKQKVSSSSKQGSNKNIKNQKNQEVSIKSKLFINVEVNTSRHSWRSGICLLLGAGSQKQEAFDTFKLYLYIMQDQKQTKGNAVRLERRKPFVHWWSPLFLFWQFCSSFHLSLPLGFSHCYSNCLLQDHFLHQSLSSAFTVPVQWHAVGM